MFAGGSFQADSNEIYLGLLSTADSMDGADSFSEDWQAVGVEIELDPFFFVGFVHDQFECLDLIVIT